MGQCSWIKCNHKEPYEREVGGEWAHVEEERDNVPVEAETGGEARNQRMPTATRRQKRRNRFFPGASRGSMKCQYLDLVPVKRISGFWPSEKCKDKFVLL